MKKAIKGFLYGPHFQHLDHLASLCSLLDIPLIVTESEMEELGSYYYPSLVIKRYNYTEVAHSIFSNTDWIITAYSREIIDEIFFMPQAMHKKKINSIWCPHGNSEKGFSDYFKDILQKEPYVLCYGPKIANRLPHHQALIPIGNYRKLYFEKTSSFYNTILDKEIWPKLSKSNKTILYAPTWKNNDVWEEIEKGLHMLIHSLTPDYNLILKLHPNTLLKFELECKIFKESIDSTQHVIFLEQFPLIYPILNITNLLIGDETSVVYDFLSYSKPMLLINQDKPFAQNLQSLNDPSLKETIRFTFINDPIENTVYKTAYKEAFYEGIPAEKLKKNIINIVGDFD